MFPVLRPFSRVLLIMTKVLYESANQLFRFAEFCFGARTGFPVTGPLGDTILLSIDLQVVYAPRFPWQLVTSTDSVKLTSPKPTDRFPTTSGAKQSPST
jgi:hypothetical protein